MQAVDVLIVGSGLAGLRLALALPETVSVVIVTKRLCKIPIRNGLKVVLQQLWEEDDSWQAHVKDTLRCWRRSLPT